MKTVNEAFTRFLQQPGRSHATKQKFRYKFKAFLAEWGETAVCDVSSQDIEGWFKFLEDRKGYSEGHLAFHRSCHITFWGWLGRNIVTVPRFKQTPAAAKTATDNEIRKLLETCERLWATIHQQRDAAIVTLGTAGLRRSNIQRTRLSETQKALASPVDGRFYILRTKGKQPMDAVLDPQRAGIIGRYLTNRPDTQHDRFFVNLNQHDPHYLDPLSAEALARARRRVCQMAGLRVITFQEMRRWLGTKIARTKNIQIAAQALGHKSGVSVILNHYYNPEDELTRTAVLDAYLF